MKTPIPILQVERAAGDPRRILLGCLSVLMVLVCAGCKPEAKGPADVKPASGTATTTDATGAYALVTVDGNPVPCTLTHEGHTMTIKSGRFVIKGDGTCSSQMFLEGVNAPIERGATYTQAGSKLTMKWAGFGTTTGQVDDNTFTMDNEGMVLAYRK